MSGASGPPAYTPAQREVIAQLGASRETWPEFDADLRDRLRDDIAEELGPWSGSLTPDDPLFVSKHSLMRVHGCEALYAHEQSTPGFDWIVPIAVGSVAHKAIELSVHWRGEALAADLVDESLARLSADDYGLARFLQGLSEADRAQLRSDSNDRVSAFLETWPRLKAAWRPVTESRVRAEFLGGRIVAQGKVDITLGHADGSRAGKVIVDLKTGRRRSTHRDDLRFYSLIETLRVGTPPRRVASYYLDEGRFVAEDVTEDTLEAAIARLVAGVAAMVELNTDERAARKRPSAGCRWCPVRETGCAEGDAFLAVSDGEDGADF